jgi:copper transport protein
VRASLAALAAFIALALPATAPAHATLVRSVPASGAALSVAPRAARFVFDDPVRPAGGIEAVRSDGTSVAGGAAHVVGGRTLVVPLRAVARGDYTVLWRVISDDGHTEAGVVTFSVGTSARPGAAALSASAGIGARAVVSRWLFFAGLLVAAGGVVFRLAVGPARVSVLLPALVACFLGATALLPHEAVFTSRFGGTYAVAAILAALGATAAAVASVDARAARVAWAAALLLLPLPSIAGHALDAGRPRIEVAVDALHLAAAAVWTGGLVQLALALRIGEEGRSRIARRLSTVALVAVVVPAASGVVRALGELSAVSQLWSTSYGRTLFVKTALLGALAALGWLNRYRLLPRHDVAGVRRSVTAELLLLAGLLLAVAFLTDLRPGRDRDVAQAATPPARGVPPSPPSDAVVRASEDGDNALAVAAEPKRVQVTVLGQNGLGVNGLRVRIDGGPAGHCGAGCYERDGTRRQNIVVVISGRRLVFQIPLRAPAASGLVRRATRAFRRLRSVSYVERLASSPRNKLVTTFTLEAPNRLRYRIHGGARATVIGTKRWDGCTRSTTSQLPQPIPIWGLGPVANAHVLDRARSKLLVSFLVPGVPAWFEAWFDRRTLRPRTLDMTATAHFMHHTYYGFNAPRQIFPPKC